MGVPKNRWRMRENTTKMDGLGVPIFQETTIYIYTYIHIYICGSVLTFAISRDFRKKMMNMASGFTISSHGFQEFPSQTLHAAG